MQNPWTSVVAGLLFALVCPSISAAEPGSTLYQAYLADTEAGRPPLLPDFSYAGYAQGERPIPALAGPVFDVTQYGALPDSDQPAYDGIQKAIAACEAAGGGVVWFPKGTYRVNPAPSDAKSPRLRVRSDNVVLRGAGSGLEGSILFMEAEILPQDSEKMWSGQAVLQIAPAHAAPRDIVGEVRGAVLMNQRRIPVKAGHHVQPGDRIRVTNDVKGEDLQALNQRVAPRTWNPGWTHGLHLSERHVVEQVEDEAIILREALLIPIAADQTWTLVRTQMVHGVGIEGLRFQGNWHEPFVHHRDWRHDSGWRGIHMTGVEDCWIRDCVFADMNWPVQLADSRNCTMERLVFTGAPGHFGIQATACTNVLNLEIRDEAGHYHGPSLQNGSSGIVYHRTRWRADGCFDSHAGASYANLFELGSGGFEVNACGGAFAAFPHHLHGCVIWNHAQTSVTQKAQEFWPEVMNGGKKSFLQVILVGLTGPRPDLHQVAQEESTGTNVEPRSLWLAQLRRRLGTIPGHFQGYDRPTP